MTTRRRKGLPYEDSASGRRALVELQSIVERLGAARFGSMIDYERNALIVQFTHRGITVHVEASISGYAAAWLKAHPYGRNTRRTRVEHERAAQSVAMNATHSILRDWIKGQLTAVECGVISFEGAFLGQIMLSSGRTALQHVQDHKLLPTDGAST